MGIKNANKRGGLSVTKRDETNPEPEASDNKESSNVFILNACKAKRVSKRLTDKLNIYFSIHVPKETFERLDDANKKEVTRQYVNKWLANMMRLKTGSKFVFAKNDNYYKVMAQSREGGSHILSVFNKAGEQLLTDDANLFTFVIKGEIKRVK